jgi:SAM-dependent methyltransferase
MSTSISYPGLELEFFERATNWKAYWGQFVRPFLSGRVAEVGAGIGATTLTLCTGQAQHWLCLEPDAQMADQIRQKIAAHELPSFCEAWPGVMADLPHDRRFDTILYIDVLEHIEDDQGEIRESALRLAPGGHLVVLAPSHNWLYSQFDRHVGHHRRYNRGSLARLVPQDLECQKLIYLDSIGMFLSLGNRLVLRSNLPTHDQIRVWDKRVIPLSRALDPLFRYALGKSVLGVWRRDAA